MANYKAIYQSWRVAKDGTANLKIRITHNNSQAFIPTSIYIDANYFDNKEGKMPKGTPNWKWINSRIASLLAKCQKKELELEDRADDMTAVQIREHILKGKSKSSQIDFLYFCRNIAPTLVGTEGYGEQFKFLANSLERYVKNPVLPVSHITRKFLRDYKKYLEQDCGIGSRNYLRTFRAVFNKCRDEYNDEDTGVIVIPQYPFRDFKIPKPNEHNRKHVLFDKELALFRDYTSSKPNLQFARDMYMLDFYLIGIESIDLYHLRKPDIEGRIIYKRFKTGKEFSIKLEPEALEIIERYKGEKNLLDLSERFPTARSFMASWNRNLRGEERKNNPGVVGELGIDKRVTSKWARHTWATIARNRCRIDKDDVALCLGHKDTDNEVTDMYHFDDYTIQDDSNRRVIDYLNSL